MKITADSMHRLVKLAMDTGEAAGPEEAKDIFSRYRLRIHLGVGWADKLAGQSAFLTALNTAARAFLGGVVVSGDVSQTLRVPLFSGKTAADVVPLLGGQVVLSEHGDIPTVVIGHWGEQQMSPFCIRLAFDGWQAGCMPVQAQVMLSCEMDNPLAGVAAAALGVNEAFLHVRGDLFAAGDREVGISLWGPAAIGDWASRENRGPGLEYLPAALWLIGLGHLGQAYVWTLGMLPYARDRRPHLVLQDIDTLAESNLSTCMLVSPKQVGRHKTRVVAEVIEDVGFSTDIVERRFTELQRVAPGDPTTALVGVDNVIARRSIDSAGFGLVLEAGLGSGYRDFRNIRTHLFPGPRRATDIWTVSDAVQRAIDLSPVYERMAAESQDRCGVMQLAARSVATPFVGAMAAALVIGEVVRLLHGGPTYSTMDLQLKDMRHRTAAEAQLANYVMPAFVRAAVLC